ncbi:hypothetical protein KL915_004092, partial [Ogataea haglerorum]|jgi:hypothetical protein
MADH